MHDKESGQDIISPEHQAPMLEYAVERPRGMSSWLVDFRDNRERSARIDRDGGKTRWLKKP